MEQRTTTLVPTSVMPLISRTTRIDKHQEQDDPFTGTLNSSEFRHKAKIETQMKGRQAILMHSNCIFYVHPVEEYLLI